MARRSLSKSKKVKSKKNTIMKKIYEIPQIEVTLLESTELMQASMGVYSDETTSNPLTRDIIFDDDED